MKEPDSFVAVWDENSRSWICEEHNAWSWTGEPGTWKPRIGNPKKAEEMAKKTKKEPAEPVVNDVYPDTVYHPPHYVQGRKIEPIDVIEDWGLGYHLGNSLKYVARMGRKESAIEDCQKAIWYLTRHLDRLKAGAK